MNTVPNRRPKSVKPASNLVDQVEQTVAEVAKNPAERRERPRRLPAVIYSTSHWHAQSHLAKDENGRDRGTLIEADFPDPWQYFPLRIMKNVDYGLKNGGLDCRVVGYRNVDGMYLGVILTLFSGNNLVACYAYRNDGKKNQGANSQMERPDGETLH